MKYCIDCNKILSKSSYTRCKSCRCKIDNPMKGRLGELSPRFKKNKIKYYCVDCNKQVKDKRSIRCYSCNMLYRYSISKDWIKGINNPNWKNGKSYEIYPLGWNKTYKEQIRRRDEYKCQICGIPEVECNKKLSIHHKDYNKSNIKDDNLISLCTSCHVKTNFRRDEWVSFFDALTKGWDIKVQVIPKGGVPS